MATPRFEDLEGSEAPTELPSRKDLLTAMLTATGRGGVPIRSDFVQLPRGTEGSRHGLLAKFTTDELGKLSLKAVKGLTTDNVASLTSAQASSFTQAQLQAMDQAQVEAIQKQYSSN